MGEHAGVIAAMFDGAAGWTVRCAPRRRTVMAASAGATLYGKLHRRRRALGAAEWRWLHLLPMLGVAAARPVAWVARGARSMVVTEAVAGRSLDAWACDAARDGWLDEWWAFVCDDVAGVVRQLHGQRLIYRDLNFAHLFAGDPRTADAAPPTLIDVERMFRPRWRWRRWVVKDLASLLASCPVPVPDRVALRFLRTYVQGAWPRRRRGWLRAIRAKADAIAGRRPRYG